ncbi:hypothetical protein ABPG72_004857 [Tetrahymena utriculariae]
MRQILQTLVLANLIILASSQGNLELQNTLAIRGQVIKQFEKSQLSMKDSILDHQNSYISLDDGVQTAFLTEEDHFVLKGITPGKHTIEFTSKLYQYFKIIVIYNPQISDEDSQVTIYSIDPNTYERVQEFTKPNQVIIKPVQSKIIKYFEEVEGFNIISLLFSGQGIFIVVMVLMYFCMKNVDMEKLQQQAQEAQQTQAVQS